MVAVGHGGRVHRVADALCFGLVTVVRWVKRIWRYAEPACPVVTFSEQHELIAPRAKLTTRDSVGDRCLAHDDTTVSALARHLGVDWQTLWYAIEREATLRLADPARLDGVQGRRGRAHLATIPGG
ncbi:hypothetical protein GCM10027053_26160 [Intrasporangium mesophilum]